MQPPADLAALQEAFGRAVSEPLVLLDSGCRARTEAYAPELLTQVAPSAELTERERVAVYNRQYWFRLLTILQQEYPLLERILEINPFNQMMMRFLSACPPRSYSLQSLSDKLVPWLEAEAVSRLVLQAATLEYQLIRTFDAANVPPWTALALPDSERHDLARQVLVLQPHAALFVEDWALVEARLAITAAGNDAPERVEPGTRQGFWLIYRDAEQQTQFEALGPLQYRLLAFLDEGVPVGEALARVCEQASLEQEQFLHQHVQSWFAQWVQRGWWAGTRA